MLWDPVLLSRIQFAWVIGWHIVLPAFTVGAASFFAVVEGLSLTTGREVYVRISNFWTKIFAIAFGMGAVTGIIMPFQFGTNWSRFASAGANILSPLFAYEGLTAFLEAAFSLRPQARAALDRGLRSYFGTDDGSAEARSCAH